MSTAADRGKRAEAGGPLFRHHLHDGQGKTYQGKNRRAACLRARDEGERHSFRRGAGRYGEDVLGRLRGGVYA